MTGKLQRAKSGVGFRIRAAGEDALFAQIIGEVRNQRVDAHLTF